MPHLDLGRNFSEICDLAFVNYVIIVNIYSHCHNIYHKSLYFIFGCNHIIYGMLCELREETPNPIQSVYGKQIKIK